MNLATENTSTVMSIYQFSQLFKYAFIPLFKDSDLDQFFSEEVGKEAMKTFKKSFIHDHKAVDKLSIEDRMRKFRFDDPEKRSVQNELFV